MADEEEASRREPLAPPTPEPRPDVAKKTAGKMSDFTSLVELIAESKQEPDWEAESTHLQTKAGKVVTLASDRGREDRPTKPPLPITGAVGSPIGPIAPPMKKRTERGSVLSIQLVQHAVSAQDDETLRERVSSFRQPVEVHAARDVARIPGRVSVSGLLDSIHKSCH